MSREIAPQTNPADMELGSVENELPEGVDVCNQCGRDYPIEAMRWLARSCVYLCIDCLDKLLDDQ